MITNKIEKDLQYCWMEFDASGIIFYFKIYAQEKNEFNYCISIRREKSGNSQFMFFILNVNKTGEREREKICKEKNEISDTACTTRANLPRHLIAHD